MKQILYHMAYRWHNGRLLSDEEYYSETSGSLAEEFSMSMDIFGMFAAVIIPLIGIPTAGYYLFEGPGIIVGIVLAIIFIYMFHKLLSKILATIFKITLITAVIAFIGYIGYCIWTI